MAAIVLVFVGREIRSRICRFGTRTADAANDWEVVLRVFPKLTLENDFWLRAKGFAARITEVLMTLFVYLFL